MLLTSIRLKFSCMVKSYKGLFHMHFTGKCQSCMHFTMKDLMKRVPEKTACASEFYPNWRLFSYFVDLLVCVFDLSQKAFSTLFQ